MGQDAFNQYRIMWVFVMFDLPTETKKQRQLASNFRTLLMKAGFTMFQLSIYIRHCPSKANADVHIRRVEKILPKEGHVVLFYVTDKQFGEMKLYYGKTIAAKKTDGQQLMLF